MPLPDNSRVSGTTAATLVITNVQPGDAGGYTVVVSNALGGITSSIAALTLATTPYVNGGNPYPSPPYTNWAAAAAIIQDAVDAARRTRGLWRSEEHTSELQSLRHLVCR